MTSICLHNATVLTGFCLMQHCAVLTKDGKVEDVFNEERLKQKNLPADTVFLDVQGDFVLPGFIDSHIHGFGGYGTDDYSRDSILKMSEALLPYGVTAFIPTLYTAGREKLLQGIQAVVSAMGHEQGAKILGVHLEGPFISPQRVGAQDASAICPVDLDLMDELWTASRGHIINMTVAPELKHMRELALYCASRGIVLQAGHTNATYAQMIEGMQVSILHVTHLFDAMSGMHHRDPGAVGSVFIHPELSCEIIADGVHIHPDIIKFLLRCKSLDKVVLITDALKPTKQKTLPLIANGDEVYLNKCFYRKADNILAGSALSMLDCVKNIVSFGFTLEQAVQMASINPARIMKQQDIGLIAPGYQANLIVMSPDFNVKATMIQGRFCYQQAG